MTEEEVIIKIGQSEKSIFDKYVSIKQTGQSIHRYEIEAEFEQINKKYRNPQVVELLLKKAAESNREYNLLFSELYGDMIKHGGGDFKL